MESDQPASSSTSRRIALLIDADNVSLAKVAAILAELAKYGTANIRRAYGDWGSAALKGWKSKLHEFAIRPIQQFSYSTGKNATDIALVIDAMELLYTQRLDAFCIASSDADFTPLIMQLKANGHDVYGFGERKTPLPFVNACTTFLYLDSLDGAATSSQNDEAPQKKRRPSRRQRLERKPAQKLKLLLLLPALDRFHRMRHSSPSCVVRLRRLPAKTGGQLCRRQGAPQNDRHQSIPATMA
jgi:uncharacterized protein (TIGR00288 family)